MTKVVITGAAGRMGQTLIRCACKMDEIELVGAVDREDHPELGKDVGAIAGIEDAGVVLSCDLRQALMEADVLIDFSLHAAVAGNTNTASELRRAIVIGTTGLDESETEVVNKASGNVPIVWAPNMSVGVNVLFHALKKAASVFGSNYSVEIDETHHIHKKDAPSGTALRLGEKVAEGLDVDFKQVMLHDLDGAGDIHDKNRIVIRSHREGEVAGDHAVSFANDAETIEFTHHAKSRESFAIGALRAAQWVTSRKPGLYDMQDVLELNS